jgi:hypothetical protein
VKPYRGRAGWRSAALATVGVLLAGAGRAYPLDGYEATGIRRLEGMRLAQQGAVRDVKQPPGALLNTAQVEPRLVGKTFDLPAPDPGFTQRIVAVLGGNPDASGLAVLDLSDPAKPVYAEHRGDHKQNVGSVGKLVVALALFQALADLYPDDTEARRKVLKTTVVSADSFSQSDHHTVRMFDPATNTLTRRTVRVGDRATLYEWLDWMLSPSSNSAAGMVMREAMLLRHFGRAYPASEAEIQRFFSETPKTELSKLYATTFHEPVTRNGLDIESLRQGSLHRRRQGQGPGRRRQLRHGARAGCASAAAGAGPPRRRLLQPRDQAAGSTSPRCESATRRHRRWRPRPCPSSPARCSSARPNRASAASPTRATSRTT